MEVKVAIKRIDNQGRIVLPLSFRRRLKRGTVLVVEREDRLEIYPVDAELSKYFDAVEVDVEHFEEYHELRRELREVHRR
jgi:bifunctional DNA-binding transcriptional regulator/antitoxin component of YhaV-PrlF toxin-antitoxin module